MENPGTIVIAALYHFAELKRFAQLQEPLREIGRMHELTGTLLLADEGINGTVAGSRAGIDALIAFLKSQPEFKELVFKESYANAMPFYRFKVRLKKEIVTMGVPGTDPKKIVGTYVDPEDWNDLLSDPDTIAIDTRNDYEVSIGTFRGAINPQTETFRGFPDWVKRNENRLRGKKIAMYCTGGIRCEKATAFVKSLGHENVFHLKGGILKYLETVDERDSAWEGDCFVFDERVAVGHGLVPADYTQCRACRHPLSPEERASPLLEEGVSCPHCHGKRSAEDRARFAERQHQIELAKSRGERHVGRVLPKAEG